MWNKDVTAFENNVNHQTEGDTKLATSCGKLSVYLVHKIAYFFHFHVNEPIPSLKSRYGMQECM